MQPCSSSSRSDLYAHPFESSSSPKECLSRSAPEATMLMKKDRPPASMNTVPEHPSSHTLCILSPPSHPTQPIPIPRASSQIPKVTGLSPQNPYPYSFEPNILAKRHQELSRSFGSPIRKRHH
jgi:hypothetical protein